MEDPRGRVSGVEFNLNQIDNYVSTKQQKLYVNNTSRWRIWIHTTSTLNAVVAHRQPHVSPTCIFTFLHRTTVQSIPPHTTLLLHLILLACFPHSATNTRVSKDERAKYVYAFLICTRYIKHRQSYWWRYAEIIRPVFLYALNVRSFNFTLINIKRTTADTQGYIFILQLKYFNRIYSGLEAILYDTIWSKTGEVFPV